MDWKPIFGLVRLESCWLDLTRISICFSNLGDNIYTLLGRDRRCDDEKLLRLPPVRSSNSSPLAGLNACSSGQSTRTLTFLVYVDLLVVWKSPTRFGNGAWPALFLRAAVTGLGGKSILFDVLGPPRISASCTNVWRANSDEEMSLGRPAGLTLPFGCHQTGSWEMLQFPTVCTISLCVEVL